MLYAKIIIVCSKINMHHRNAVCAQNIEYFLTLNMVAHKVKVGVHRVDFVIITAKFHIHGNMHTL